MTVFTPSRTLVSLVTVCTSRNEWPLVLPSDRNTVPAGRGRYRLSIVVEWWKVAPLTSGQVDRGGAAEAGNGPATSPARTAAANRARHGFVFTFRSPFIPAADGRPLPRTFL